MKIGVVGASGYAGGELLRLLAFHPHFEVTAITAHSNAGESITSIHPQLRSYGNQKFIAFSAEAFTDCQLIFLALPHGESAKIISQLPAQAKIVDLGADSKARSGDWVTVFGNGSHGEYSADDWGLASQSINYEIVTRLGPRVPRIYEPHVY